MAAAHDIVAIRTTREILLIGPRLSLHAVPKRELLGEGEVRFRLREAASDPGDPAQIRLALARWGLDTQRTTRTRDLKLCDWIASLVGTGRLRAVIAPDTDTHLAALPKTYVPRAPIAAALEAARDARPVNTGKIAAEKSSVFAAARSMATPPPMPASMPGAPAPRIPLNVAQLDLEERLMIVLARTVESDRVSDAAKAELQALLAPETIAITVGVLALWAGSHLTPFGYVADAILLGVGVFFAGRAVLEGGKKLAKFLGLTLSARTEADLDLAADMLAAAIALLSVKLFAKLLSRGASGLNGPMRGKKATAPPPQPPTKVRQAVPDDPGLPVGKMNRTAAQMRDVQAVVDRIGTTIKNHPTRAAYENEVRALADKARKMAEDKIPESTIAKELQQLRREIGKKYKDMTPAPLREFIHHRNELLYEDKWGPTYERLRDVMDKSDAKIIQSASNPNENVDKLLSAFKDWARQQDPDKVAGWL